MRFAKLLFNLLLGVSMSATFAAPQSVPKDSQALAVLQQAVPAMGGTVPSDSTANGTVTTVAGSLTENGNIVILTRGADQTSEQTLTPHGSRVVYSRGQASQITGSNLTSLSLELAVASQCPDFPLPLLAGALNDSDFAFQYVGQETVNGVSVLHIRFWNSFASQPALQQLAEFSVRDLWVDATTGLPRKLAYSRREAQGAAPRIPVEVFYSNYRNVGGVLYPFLIQKSFNGTPWATVTISSVAFNTGLTDSDFPVQ